MKTVKIFLGSSFKLRKERQCIGNAIRKLSYKWEKNGVRVKLLVWEDFGPEYRGMSKQEEYNIHLVEKSDIATFLIKGNIGIYTQREIECALKQNKGKVLFFSFPYLKDNTKKILRKWGIKELQYQACADYINCIEKVLPSFLSKVQEQTVCNVVPKYFYATIPADMSRERMPFGNMIRSLDDIVEANCNMRCLLLEHQQLDLANHYVALLNNFISTDDVNEIKQAFGAITPGAPLEAISLFRKKSSQKDNGTNSRNVGLNRALNNNSTLNEFLRQKEAFPTSYTHLDTVKLLLLLWFVAQKQILLKRDDGLFSIQNDKIMFRKYAIADSSVIKNSQFIEYGKSMAKETQKLRNVAISSDSKTFDTCCANISNIRNSMLSLLYQELNAMSIHQTQAYHVDEHIDSHSMVTQVENEAHMLEHIHENLSEDWEYKATILASRCEYIRNHINSNDDREELLQVAKDWTEICYRIYKYDKNKYPLVLDSLQYRIGLNDIWKLNNRVLYKEYFELADNVGIDNLTVEYMRFDYANECNRLGEYSASVALYEDVIRRVEGFETQSFTERRALTHFYVTLFHSCFEYTPHGDSANRVLKEFGERVRQWLQEDKKRYLLDYGCYLSAYIKNLPIRQEDEQALNEAEQIIIQLENEILPSDDYYGDVPCFLLNIIAAYYVDRVYNCNLSESQINIFIRKTVWYSLKQIRDCGRFIKYDTYRALWMMSSAYHQIGFAYAYNLKDWKKSYKSYRKEIEIRQRLSNLCPNNRDWQDGVAECAVNIGGLLKSLYDANLLPTGMKEQLMYYADLALSIYIHNLNMDSEGSELHLYQAKLLKGTSIYVFAKNHEPGYSIADGVLLVKECWEWHLRHHNSDYAATFEAECIPILFNLKSATFEGKEILPAKEELNLSQRSQT